MSTTTLPLRNAEAVRRDAEAVRRDAEAVRRAQPRLTEQDAEVLSRVFAVSRGLPLELRARVGAILTTKLMSPILSETASVAEATRAAAAAIDEALKA